MASKEIMWWVLEKKQTSYRYINVIKDNTQRDRIRNKCMQIS